MRLLITSKFICSIVRFLSLSVIILLILISSSDIGTLFTFMTVFLITPFTIQVILVSSDRRALVCLIILSTSYKVPSIIELLISPSSSEDNLSNSIILSTYNLYPLLDGILPAEVWGCSKNPISSKSAISFLMVAELTPRLYFLAIVLEPTGSPVDI